MTEFHDGDISDDEEYEMKGQAFFVAPFDINCVDETVIPLTSQEYLQQVIAQRAKLPEVVTVTVPTLPKKSSQNISRIAIFPNENIVASAYSPSQKWQQEQIFSFSDLRYRIEVNKEKWAQNESKIFPKTKDDWFNFLFYQSDNVKGVTQNLPYLSIVLSMRNETMETLIKYIVDFVIEEKVSVHRSGSWLFGLLACIELPVCITLMRKLRALVRKCRDLREKLNFTIAENEKELTAQNLFICLICKYFGQHDLSD